MGDLSETSTKALVKVAAASAAVATRADHEEHGEPSAPGTLDRAGQLSAEAAFELATERGLPLLAAYADRLQEIEEESPFGPSGSAPIAIRNAGTWRQIQAAQIEHDRQFHPDVLGLSKSAQIRHYAFHLAKFPDAILSGDERQLRRKRIPDMLLFAVKLWTVSGRHLPGTPVSGHITFSNGK